MAKVLVIGAGGVSSVCVHKMAMNIGIFGEIHLASRTRSKCDAIAASVLERTGVTVHTYEIDAEEVPALPSGSASAARSPAPAARSSSPMSARSCSDCSLMRCLRS